MMRAVPTDLDSALHLMEFAMTFVLVADVIMSNESKITCCPAGA